MVVGVVRFLLGSPYDGVGLWWRALGRSTPSCRDREWRRCHSLSQMQVNLALISIELVVVHGLQDTQT